MPPRLKTAAASWIMFRISKTGDVTHAHCDTESMMKYGTRYSCPCKSTWDNAYYIPSSKLVVCTGDYPTQITRIFYQTPMGHLRFESRDTDDNSLGEVFLLSEETYYGVSVKAKQETTVELNGKTIKF